MGPDAYRVAGLEQALSDLGHTVTDIGDTHPDQVNVPEDAHLFSLPECVGWTQALSRTANEVAEQGLPIFMGGDHALSMGTVTGMAAHADEIGRPLFVLWLDAHSDFHTPSSTDSGNPAAMSDKQDTSKLWGGRFSEATDSFVQRFTASVEFDQRMAEQDIAGSLAHADMLCALSGKKKSCCHKFLMCIYLNAK